MQFKSLESQHFTTRDINCSPEISSSEDVTITSFHSNSFFVKFILTTEKCYQKHIQKLLMHILKFLATRTFSPNITIKISNWIKSFQCSSVHILLFLNIMTEVDPRWCGILGYTGIQIQLLSFWRESNWTVFMRIPVPEHQRHVTSLNTSNLSLNALIQIWLNYVLH